MIKILTESGELKLAPRTNIRFEEPSPLFNYDLILGAHSFPLKVPSRPNRKLLRFADVIDNKASFIQNEPCCIQIAGNNWFEGCIKINAVNRDFTSVSLFSGTGAFANIIKSKKLSDLKLGGIRNLPPDAFSIADHARQTALSGTFDYVFFPIKNSDFYGNANNDYCGYMNEWDFDNDTFFHNTTVNNYCISPQIYVHYLLRCIFEENGYSVSGEFFLDAELMKLVLYNNTAMEHDSGFALNEYSSYIDLKNHVPKVSIGAFLIALRKLFGIDFYFHKNRKHVEIRFLKSIVQNSLVSDYTAFSSAIGREISQEYAGFKLSFSDETGNTQPKPKEFDSAKFVYPPSVLQPGGYLNSGEFWFQRQENMFYCYTEMAAWKPYSEIPAAYIIGDGKIDIHSDASPVRHIIRENIPGNNPNQWGRSLPFINQKGNSERFMPSEYSEAGMRMLFYRGMQREGSGERYYPLASSITTHHDGGPLIQVGNYSLYWHDTYRVDGLYSNWWKPWISAIQNAKSIQYNQRMSIERLMNFDYADKIKVQNTHHLPQNLSYSIGEKGISIAENTLIKL